jgi:hypothetical protein
MTVAAGKIKSDNDRPAAPGKERRRRKKHNRELSALYAFRIAV